MAKIPFDIKFRPQIESGEYKVETTDGKPVRIVCWNRYGCIPIVGLVGKFEMPYVYTTNGKDASDRGNSVNDLLIITSEPEPELSGFKKRLFEIRHIAKRDMYSDEEWQTLRGEAAELLELARKELEPEVLERLEAAYKNQDEVVYENGKRDGKAEALKDLPRWRDDGLPEGSTVIDLGGLYGFDFIRRHGKLLRISDLEKLPGFKENEI